MFLNLQSNVLSRMYVFRVRGGDRWGGEGKPIELEIRHMGEPLGALLMVFSFQKTIIHTKWKKGHIFTRFPCSSLASLFMCLVCVLQTAMLCTTEEDS